MLRSLTEIKAVAVVAKKSVDQSTDGGSLAPLSEASPSNVGDASNMVIIGNAFPCDNSGRRKKKLVSYSVGNLAVESSLTLRMI